MLIDSGEKGREGESRTETSMWERNIGCLSHALTGDLACNPGMCPDWELNWQLFGSQDDAPANWTTSARANGGIILKLNPGSFFNG